MNNLLSVALMAVLALAFTACEVDDDAYIADTLAGTWKGNMYVSSTYGGYTYDATYTELCFNTDPYTYSSGTGYWIDYYSGGAPYDYVANHIEWTVYRGMIKIHLIEENTYVQIGNYRLDDGYFDGVIYYGDNQVDFRLNHTASPNWNNYYYGYDYYYNAKKSADFTRSVVETTTPELPVRIIGKK